MNKKENEKLKEKLDKFTIEVNTSDDHTSELLTIISDMKDMLKEMCDDV